MHDKTEESRAPAPEWFWRKKQHAPTEPGYHYARWHRAQTPGLDVVRVVIHPARLIALRMGHNAPYELSEFDWYGPVPLCAEEPEDNGGTA